MDSNKRKQLHQRLEQLDGNERNKLYKRAVKLRKAAQGTGHTKRDRRQGRKLAQHWDQAPRKNTKRYTGGSIQDWMLKLLEEDERAFGFDEPGLWEQAGSEALVISLSPGRCEVWWDDQRVECQLSQRLARAQKTELAVGDRVLVARQDGAPPLVFEVAPRSSRLSRPDPSLPHIERVLVANVELVLVVASARMPHLKPGLIDRFLIASQRGGVPAAICVNKMDLLCSEAERLEIDERLEPYRQLGIPVFSCSTVTGAGVEAIREEIRHRRAVFVGHSGVGKSSLLNALAPQQAARVGEVRASDGKGRHTTTGSTLHQLESKGWIIDTPGIRSLGLWRMDKGEVGWYFPEFVPFAQQCNFRDCTHSHEPRCGVREAADEGLISGFRFETYLRILRSLEGRDHSAVLSEAGC